MSDSILSLGVMGATEMLTLVLVLVTAYYAWQNRKMVKEMAAARKVSLLPKLALEWTMVSPILGFPTVKNVGPGAALDVDISIRFEPLPGKEGEEDVRRYTASVIVPGEDKQFLPRDQNGSAMHTEDLAATYRTITLTGSYRDALSNTHTADDTLGDIAEWRRVMKESFGRWEEPDLAKRQAKEIAERLGKKTLVPALTAIEKKLDK